MDSTKQTLNKLNTLFLKEDNKEDKLFLEKGLSPEDRDKILSSPKTIGELIDILNKVPRETKISYNYAYLDFVLEEDEICLVVSD